MIIAAQTIRLLATKSELIKPFTEQDTAHGMTYGLGPCGYDIRLDQRIYVKPGGYALGSTMERFNIPDTLVMHIRDKSTWVRRGITVANTVAEPGWRGFLTVEVFNHSNGSLIIDGGTPIAQVMFELLNEATELPYAGKYQNAPRGPQLAVLR